MMQYVPNILTILRLFAVPVFVLCYYYWYNPMLGLILFVLASITDYFDGWIARKYNVISNFGKLMDPLADKILVLSAMIILALPPINYIHWSIVGIIALREISVTILRDYYRTKNIIIPANIWGKLKTVFQMIGIIAALLLYALIPYLRDYVTQSVIEKIKFGIVAFFWLIASITILSGLNYFIIKKR